MTEEKIDLSMCEWDEDENRSDEKADGGTLYIRKMAMKTGGELTKA